MTAIKNVVEAKSLHDPSNSIHIFKRISDLIVALALLIFTAPLLAMIALAIKCDSPGPILYRQERVGRGGRRFVLLKFRSMVSDAERDGRPVWAAERDARISRVGRFIRQTRIDELPQLINVLRGDMSLVGPRPERPFFVEYLNQVIPYYDRRHSVHPGITGWAQVNYPYGASVEDSRRKLMYDLEYLAKANLFFDIKILLLTVGVIVLRSGAR